MSSDEYPPGYGYQPQELSWQVEPVERPRPQYGKDILAALVLAAVVAAFGFVLDAVWRAVAPTLPLRKVADGAVYTTPDPEEVIAGDGWFVIIGLGFGLLMAVLAWTIGRRFRGAIQLVGLTLGCLAAGLLVFNVAGPRANDEFRRQLAAAPVDSLIDRPTDLRVVSEPWCDEGEKDCVGVGGVLLVPALGAVLGYALIAAWSNRPDLRAEEPASTDLWTSSPY